MTYDPLQCQEGIQQVEQRLKELGVRYLKLQVIEGGVLVDQFFFHDPDGLRFAHVTTFLSCPSIQQVIMEDQYVVRCSQDLAVLHN